MGFELGWFFLEKIHLLIQLLLEFSVTLFKFKDPGIFIEEDSCSIGEGCIQFDDIVTSSGTVFHDLNYNIGIEAK